MYRVLEVVVTLMLRYLRMVEVVDGIPKVL